MNEAKNSSKKWSFKKVWNNAINLERLDRDVLIERAHYYAIINERGRTNRGGLTNAAHSKSWSTCTIIGATGVWAFFSENI